jgi:DNA-binding PadR family transcriptional regulator
MSSTTRLLVLGVVRIFQPVHGYEVRRELTTWRAQEWASIKVGSIYNALKTLTRDGFLEVVSTDQVGGRPERTTYRLTPAGDEEFHLLLREEWWTLRMPTDPLMAAISFLGFVRRSEAIAALEHRTAQIHGMVRGVEYGIEAHDGRESPPHVREMMRLMNARVLAEIGWAEQFLARLRRGEYHTADDPPWKTTPAAKPRRRATARTPRPAATDRAGRRREPAEVARPVISRDRDRRREPGDRTRDGERKRRVRSAPARSAPARRVRRAAGR